MVAIPQHLYLGFIALALGLWVLLAWRFSRVGAKSVAVFFLGWMVISALLSMRGVLGQWKTVPPPMLIVFLVQIFGVIWLATLSPWKNRLAKIPQPWLVGIQAFRIPTELLMAGLATASLLPPEMTFHGYNFDVVTGLCSVILACALNRKGSSGFRTYLILFNVLGLTLLFIVAGMGALSAPTLFQPLHISINNIHIARFPLVWLPTFLVPTALLLHLISLRKLSRQRADVKHPIP